MTEFWSCFFKLQAKRNAVKCLCKGPTKMMNVGFETRTLLLRSPTKRCSFSSCQSANLFYCSKITKSEICRLVLYNFKLNVYSS